MVDEFVLLFIDIICANATAGHGLYRKIGFEHTEPGGVVEVEFFEFEGRGGQFASRKDVALRVANIKRFCDGSIVIEGF